jgi:LAO/AO transport system kinase
MKLLDKNEYTEGILNGNTVVLSRAITLLESTRLEHNVLAREILEDLLPHTRGSKRIGVTGVPGVGKSTFIEAVGETLIARGGKLAILAIDPSSQLTKGSILGDKTRMERLNGHPKVYIRPTPAGGALGGVGRKTRETIMLCEAAGYDKIIVETVGVGQSEIAVHSMIDCFLLLLLPGAGDELQGIKRGIMEMADIICINKAYDGSVRLPAAKKAIQELKNALHYFPQKEHSWLTQVLAMDALSGENLSELTNAMSAYFEHQDLKGFFQERRRNQDLYWFEETIKYQILNNFFTNESIKKRIQTLKLEILSGKISSFKAAEEILEGFGTPDIQNLK